MKYGSPVRKMQGRMVMCLARYAILLEQSSCLVDQGRQDKNDSWEGLGYRISNKWIGRGKRPKRKSGGNSGNDGGIA